MTLGSTYLLTFASLLLVAGCGGLVYLAFASDTDPLHAPLERYAEELDRKSSFLSFPYRGRQIARAQLVAVVILIALAAVTRQGLLAALTLVVAGGPPFFLWRRQLARVALLERQLDSWLLMLANALKATPSVGEAIASTVTLVPNPIGEELDLLVKEIRLGTPLDRAIHALARRIDSEVFAGALATVLVARQTGGDLPKTLERAAAALRESARLEGVLRTKTAEGRGQVLVLASIPFLLCFIIAWLDPTWFDPMLESEVGRVVLSVCVVTWSLAVLWARHIVGAEL